LTLAPGTRLGVYEITGSLGAGGMGEVYRARDAKLQRDVAIKVLPELFASDPDRLARFEREALSLAALNHPNIAQVFGVLEQPPALAMELVEGEDLSERIERGAMPIDEALPIAKQIAEAVEAAHDRGIVHRDLKPANIKVRTDGAVKVLDFGLAKAIESTAPGGTSVHTLVMNSPTFTAPAVTAGGVILGTAAYMAPEQARGKAVDKRADIWAFGVILFEMLSGRQLFSGETASDLLAAVLREEIDWRALPAGIPASVRRTLERCLQKDPRRRLRDIGDARLDIEDAIAGKDNAPATVPGEVRGSLKRRLPLFAAMLVATFAAGVFATWLSMRGRAVSADPVRTIRLDVMPSQDVKYVSNVALSADATFVVYTGSDAEQTALYVHRFDANVSRIVAGTAGAQWPFISPDGKWVAFFRSGKLLKVAIAGGDVLTLCDAAGGPGATWLRDGRIVYANSWLTGLWVVPEDGGKPTALTTLDAGGGEKGHWWPDPLPDGKLLFTVFMAGAGLNDNRVAVLDLASGRHQVLFPGAKASWLPSGHLLFYRAGRYQVVPFDARSMRITGEPVHVLDDAVGLDPAGDWPQPVMTSPAGALAYVPGEYIPPARVVWISPDGKITATTLPVRPYINIALSPDDERVALATFEGGRFSMRVAELSQGSDTALEADGMSWDPVWHPDGRLAFTNMRKGDFDIYIKDPARNDRETPLLQDGMDSMPSTWTSDGRLVFDGSDPDGTYVLKLLDPRRPAEIRRLTVSDGERASSLSPDEKWLAFSAVREGRMHVLVQPFPGPGPVVQTSHQGGNEPVFLRGTRELYFRRGSQLWSASWEEVNGRFVVGPERVVAKVPLAVHSFGNAFSVARDGRALALVRAEEPKPPRISVIFGWAQGLRTR
jgi:Tol biopolymer transport system component